MVSKEFIAKKLLEARKLAGLTQVQASEKMHIHQGTVASIELGYRNVTVVELTKFADIYSIDLKWFFNQEWDKFDDKQIKLRNIVDEFGKLDTESIRRLIRILVMSIDNGHNNDHSASLAEVVVKRRTRRQSTGKIKSRAKKK
jgi:transcriptional regulator with XRE-family HTH domain